MLLWKKIRATYVPHVMVAATSASKRQILVAICFIISIEMADMPETRANKSIIAVILGPVFLNTAETPQKMGMTITGTKI